MTEDHCVNAAKGDGEVREVWGGGGEGVKFKRPKCC